MNKLADKFGKNISEMVIKIAQHLLGRGLMLQQNSHLSLTGPGLLISNQIFEKFTFLAEDLA